MEALARSPPSARFLRNCLVMRWNSTAGALYQTGIHALDAVGDNERFVRALQGDARLLDMLLRAGGAAAVTDWEAKRIAMGRVLAGVSWLSG